MGASTWGACTLFLYNWQTLIAGVVGGLIGGGLTVVAGLFAYRGALQQVGAVKLQIDALEDERKETDRRRRIVVEGAAMAEGTRVKTAATAALTLLANDFGVLTAIESSPLLNFEREDVALLDDDVRDALAAVTNLLTVYAYLVRDGGGWERREQIQPVLQNLIKQVDMFQIKLADVGLTDGRTNPG
jgi:hypothetical protein